MSANVCAGVGTFTAHTIPAGLLSRHNTKAEVYAEINVVAGELLYTTLEGEIEEVVLAPGRVGVAGPGQFHVVKPLTDSMEMFIRFHAVPGSGPLADGATVGEGKA